MHTEEKLGKKKENSEADPKETINAKKFIILF